MSTESSRILNEVLALPAHERAQLVEKILDSLGGGFITRSLLSYWFIKRFGVGTEWVGILFAASSLINSVSYFVAAWIAARIGLMNTMFVAQIGRASCRERVYVLV